MVKTLHLIVGLFLAAAATAASAQPYKAPRNALGQPDLEGVWSFNSLTRLERPDVYPSVVITAAQARSIRPLPLIGPDDVGQAESETYDAEGLEVARIGDEFRAAWIVDPPDGRLPYTPEGRARAYKPPTFANPEERTNQERCLILPALGPPLSNGLYNNHLQILQTRDHLLIFFEQGSEVRIVPIGQQAHGLVRRWMGETTGRWEGEVFVMRTTNFWPTQTQRFYPLAMIYLSKDAVVTERLQRISATQILYSYTVSDPANYTQPWRGEMPLNVSHATMYENACHEGNYSLPNILAGARFEERATAAVKADGGGPRH
jgi:hypothetical protein